MKSSEGMQRDADRDVAVQTARLLGCTQKMAEEILRLWAHVGALEVQLDELKHQLTGRGP